MNFVCSVILALRVAIVRSAACSIPLIAVIECLFVRDFGA